MVTPIGRMPAMSLAVVGAQYLNADGSDRRFEILLCAPGEYVALRHEPTNKHDPRAVSVWSSRNIQIGYLTAERCGRISALISEGREIEAIFQAKSDCGAWIRVAFDGEVPILGEQQAITSSTDGDEFATDEPEFYPDEVWPDD